MVKHLLHLVTAEGFFTDIFLRWVCFKKSALVYPEVIHYTMENSGINSFYFIYAETDILLNVFFNVHGVEWCICNKKEISTNQQKHKTSQKNPQKHKTMKHILNQVMCTVW